MYTIIFWEDDSTVKPLLNEDGTLHLIEGIQNADKEADKLERRKKVEARVISIEGVSE
ncbi:MAG: hypothetical protein Q8J68_07745 [Methanolobus sp.]|uniref:hypothetical protein n=1 Tax=Methanolobus sp. TaxID=1874737 RepID=UPI0027314199|nr:hypothetical protein [Methanolobus sp.]MDP2217160.1 hypothetical protein [Methanolobus sp.]